MSGQQDGIPYIGSKISLISKNDIRYEGLLFNIDTKQSMVALQTVQSFGTEHRRGGVFLSDGQTPNPEFVPASSQISQYATFKASEIKDLHVCEAAAPETQPPPPPPQQQQETCSPPLPPSPPQPPMAANQDKKSEQLLSPSALSSSSKGTKDCKEATLGRSALENRNAAKSVNESSKSENVAAAQNPSNNMSKDDKPSQNSNNGNRSSNRTIPGMGGHLLRRRERGVDGDKVPELADGEFNFTEGLGVFNKEEEFTKLEQQTSEISISTTTTTAAYEKSSFFDTISCDALDRLDGRSGRMRASEERKLNTETFGAAGLNNNNRRFYGNRGGRGGYRGGRGGRNGYRGGRGGRGRGRSNNNYGGRGDGSHRGGRGGGHQGGYNNYNRGGHTQSNGASHEAFNN